MKFEVPDPVETKRRDREVKLLINVVQPDPEYQPFYISDEATFLDVTGENTALIEERLKFYFKGELPAPLHTAVWQYVDIVKTRFPGWPDDWPTEN